MDVLKIQDGIMHVVHHEEVKVGDVFEKFQSGERRLFTVTQVHEQRPERGEYKDESKRRMWARISAVVRN